MCWKSVTSWCITDNTERDRGMEERGKDGRLEGEIEEWNQIEKAKIEEILKHTSKYYISKRLLISGFVILMLNKN